MRPWQETPSSCVIRGEFIKRIIYKTFRELPGGSAVKNLPALQETPVWSLGQIPWRRKWQPNSVFLEILYSYSRKSHGQRRLVSSSPGVHKESDTVEQLKKNRNIVGFRETNTKLATSGVTSTPRIEGVGEWKVPGSRATKEDWQDLWIWGGRKESGAISSNPHSASALGNPAAAAAESLQSCPTLCNLIDGSPPGSSIPGFLQARTLEWGAFHWLNLTGARGQESPWMQLVLKAQPPWTWSGMECGLIPTPVLLAPDSW